ncbi:hypothetical protein R5P42_004955 [Escherichia coli]|nr:hypothetical protein [Escherichia coli]
MTLDVNAHVATKFIQNNAIDQAELIASYRKEHPIISAIADIFNIDLSRFACKLENVETSLFEAFEEFQNNVGLINLEMNITPRESVKFTFSHERNEKDERSFIVVQGKLKDCIIFNPLNKPNNYPCCAINIPHERFFGHLTTIPANIAQKWSGGNENDFLSAYQYVTAMNYIALGDRMPNTVDSDSIEKSFDIIRKSTGITDMMQNEYKVHEEDWRKLEPAGILIPYVIKNANCICDNGMNNSAMNHLLKMIQTSKDAQNASVALQSSGPEDRGGNDSLLSTIVARVFSYVVLKLKLLGSGW